MNEDNEFIRNEWLEKFSWQNRAYLRNLQGMAKRDIDIAPIHAYLKDNISTKLVLATHTSSEKLLTQINYQLVYLMRFLDKKEIQPLLTKLAACYAFDQATVKLLEDLITKASIYQFKVEIVSRLFWFLKAPYPYPYPEKVKTKLMEVI